MPGYNNDPKNVKKAFDPNLTNQEVQSECGCNPAHYFEFAFQNVKVSQATYCDGKASLNGDGILGRGIDLSGILVDVSPSTVCAQLFAGRIKIGNNLITGKLHKAIQSDLRLSVRPSGFGDETTAAHFETTLDVLSIENEESSQILQELKGSTQLELYFHLNHYTDIDNESEPTRRLTGDVYGYIRKITSTIDDGSLRVKGRKLVAHPKLIADTEVGKQFLYNDPSMKIIRVTDIDGSYDISKDDCLLSLRYLDFIPFLDRNYTTPDIDEYCIYFVDEKGARRMDVGSFKGNHEEMKQTGGLLAFPLPGEIKDNGDDGMTLTIDAIKKGQFVQPLMIESEWDIVLQSERAITLASNRTTEVTARVYRKNRVVKGHQVRLSSEKHNGRSPTVTTFTDNTLLTDEKGEVKATVKAIDLMNADSLYDPVTGVTYNQLPLDRYYGSSLYLEIDNELRRTSPAVEQIEIATRVLHAFNPEEIPATEISFKQHILPLFSYYVRYYPFLHVIQKDDRYMQFFNLEDYESFRRNALMVIDRLSKDLDDFEKMPRSRDFPIGGLEMIKHWQKAGMPA